MHMPLSFAPLFWGAFAAAALSFGGGQTGSAAEGAAPAGSEERSAPVVLRVYSDYV